MIVGQWTPKTGLLYQCEFTLATLARAAARSTPLRYLA